MVQNRGLRYVSGFYNLSFYRMKQTFLRFYCQSYCLFLKFVGLWVILGNYIDNFSFINDTLAIFYKWEWRCQKV